MVSRLDRLFVLLDTGSSAVTRKAAAQQLGEVQRLHPHEIHNLLAKVHVYLGNDTWETRIAAGQAVEAIAKNVPQWRPVKVIKEEFPENVSRTQTPVQRSPTDRLEFSKFDMSKVLEKGASLLGSTGTEYEFDKETNPKERLIKQKRLIQRKLGLDMAGSLGMDTNDLFDDEDLELKNTPVDRKTNSGPKEYTANLIAENIAQVTPGMSSREKNRAKRRAKLLAKVRSADKPLKASTSSDSGLGDPPSKKQKTDKSSVDNVNGSMYIEEPGDWPFTSFCEQLANELFHPSWEVRHGAATGIREVLKVHGQSAGKSMDFPLDQQESLNQSWLEDMALRLICVLALDRFGDFVSDEVVAPIRETAAQALGVILRQMQDVDVQGVVSILLQLLTQPQWETRHGGLLGIKYLLAVRQDMTEQLIASVLPSIVNGLQDIDDDVRAVAASSLIPVTTKLVESCSDQVPAILQILWDALLELDDLTASTSSIMTLLSSLISQPSCHALTGMQQSIDRLVPRLWPFLRHNSSAVRRAALDTLHTLLGKEKGKDSIPWLDSIVQDAFKHIYQRCILETVNDVLDTVEKVWDTLLMSCPHEKLVENTLQLFHSWICLAMQPSGLTINKQLLVTAKHKTQESQKAKHARPEGNVDDDYYYIGGSPSLTPTSVERESVVLKTRLRACRLLGRLASTMGMITVADIFTFHLQYKSSVQLMVAAVTIEEAAKAQKVIQCPEKVVTQLLEVVSSNFFYDEVSLIFMRLQSQCKTVVSSFQKCFPNIPAENFPSAFTVSNAESLMKQVQDEIQKQNSKSKLVNDLKQKCEQIKAVLQEIDDEQSRLKVRTQCCIASALMLLKHNPVKINPIIKPFMEAIKKEKELQIQEKAAGGITCLIEASLTRNPCPNSKIIRNLCASLCTDPKHTPSVSNPLAPAVEENFQEVTSEAGTSRSSSPVTSGSSSSLDRCAACDKRLGILTLAKQQQAAALAAAMRRNVYSKHFKTGDISDLSSANLDPHDDTLTPQRLQRRGAKVALVQIVKHFGPDLLKKLDVLWQAMMKTLREYVKQEDKAAIEDDKIAEELVSSLQVFEAITPVIHPSLHSEVLAYTPQLIACLCLPYTSVRHMAARCISALTKTEHCRQSVMNQVMLEVIPFLGATGNDFKRQGAMESLACIIDQLGMEIIPYIVLLVVPLLGTMSDQSECIRLMATQCFATLIRLMPLEYGIPDPPSMAESLVERKAQQRKFLEQLFNTSKLENYKVPDLVKAELRKYQQDGVNWLAFLNKYKLHGILCDDMGLGKTLMSICILAGDHTERLKKHKEVGGADCAPLPSIVICPPTLMGHWAYEIEQFCPWSFLRPLQYTGPVSERIRLQKKAKKYNLIVASYDIVRNDIDFFRSLNWNYCILDEGHVIKNGKTKMSKAIKQLSANHRLILSGTPIQNNVLELWSLFDFLMPGFLGTEKQFNARYSKPILQSRDAKSSSKEQEAGALAMEALHRQVLPFLLRRLKEDVLDDLPPKIIQDYYCHLSPLQIQLYEDFAKSKAKKEVDDAVTPGNKSEDNVPSAAKSHIFQAIQYLKKVCNHPLLVLNEKHPKYSEIAEQLANQKTTLHDIQHAPKLVALKQLLQDCGIGVETLTPSQGELGGSVVGQHRVLLFCQLKSMLDIVENDLLKVQMPSVTYLRLDGTIPAGQRHGIVQRFNNDPSIDILLLTTHVGGLGLNLTGADTVIFVEHDWNPTKDLQAMDRAHRIGQKKVVNVYRLITKGTLEEKIMGLQKFKMNIANTVISQDNSSLQSMGTSQLLDLFTLDKDGKEKSSGMEGEGSQGEKGGKVTSILSSLGELWDEKQYSEEYSLDGFVQSLK